MIALLFIFLLAGLSDLHAAILRVPEEYASIQAAFDAVQENDTVWIEIGVYVEHLTGPLVSFFLIGEVQQDSAHVQRPVIDPTSVEGSSQFSCLRLVGAMSTIQNLVFRNGPEMYPHDPLYEGGVVLAGGNAAFENCLFDSTNSGCRSSDNRTVALTNCVFSHCPAGPLFVERSTVIARGCYFGHRGFTCGNESEFRDCTFDSISVSHVLNLSGQSTIENCLFRYHDAIGMSTIEGMDVSGRISGCMFLNCRPSLFALGFTRNCGESVLIEDNRFESVAPYAQAGGTIAIGCLANSSGGITTLDNNWFVRCNGESGGKCFRAVNDSTAIEVVRNRFIDNFGSGSAVLLESRQPNLRQNAFINNGYAVSSSLPCDARQNYWGDSTGPYNALFNPDGLGDRVSDSVIFDSWYPDTSFLIDATPNLPELPAAFFFSIYPNPFNSTATIALEAPTAFIASIELFNTLGQQVREIHRGPVYGHETFFLNADNFPSGIYFVSVRDIVQNSVNTSQKIALIR